MFPAERALPDRYTPGVIPSQLVVYNPMGILITYLQADRALVTEPPR